MIKYRLNCDSGHDFEAWFGSSTAYEAQEQAGHVACPVCGSAKVRRAIMAPSIATRRKPDRETRTPPTSPPPADIPAARLANDRAIPPEFLRVMRDIRREVESKAEYVGPRFAEEARKIHYEESPSRGIYGEASDEEAKELIEEGITFLPLPKLPEEEN